jgi:hypothetical protein
MRRLKWTIWTVLALLVVAFLHYTLPQHDVVRITGLDNRQTTVSWVNKYFYASPDAGTGESATNRYVRLIYTARPDGSTGTVFRNEDTGWIWPPYFKYDSSSLQATAANYQSTETAPKWVMITHYGWRLPFLSIYPNALRIVPVSGPDYSYFPWLNLVILAALAGLVFMARRMWLQFWERMVDPAVAGMQEAGDRTRGWFARLFGRKS